MNSVTRIVVWRIILFGYLAIFFASFAINDRLILSHLLMVVVVSTASLLVIRSYLLGTLMILGKFDLHVDEKGLRFFFAATSFLLLTACLVSLFGYT